jgi:uncharacterized protein (UPF0218 family)
MSELKKSTERDFGRHCVVARAHRAAGHISTDQQIRACQELIFNRVDESCSTIVTAVFGSRTDRDTGECISQMLRGSDLDGLVANDASCLENAAAKAVIDLARDLGVPVIFVEGEEDGHPGSAVRRRPVKAIA